MEQTHVSATAFRGVTAALEFDAERRAKAAEASVFWCSDFGGATAVLGFDAERRAKAAEAAVLWYADFG